MQTNVNYKHIEGYNNISLKDKEILQSLNETLVCANKVKRQTEELNKYLTPNRYLTRIFTKWMR